MMKSILSAYRRWQSIRETEAALYALSNRELDDLGISRRSIHDLAVKNARG